MIQKISLAFKTFILPFNDNTRLLKCKHNVSFRYCVSLKAIAYRMFKFDIYSKSKMKIIVYILILKLWNFLYNVS